MALSVHAERESVGVEHASQNLGATKADKEEGVVVGQGGGMEGRQA